MKPTFHAEIGLGHYQLFLKCKVPNEIKKKALSAAESPTTIRNEAPSSQIRSKS